MQTCTRCFVVAALALAFLGRHRTAVSAFQYVTCNAMHLDTRARLVLASAPLAHVLRRWDRRGAQRHLHPRVRGHADV